ncbi:MAG: CorA family divalent cation transporter [Mobilitalea sp.]
MFYQVQERITKINIKDINPDILTFGTISLRELKACYSQFGFSHSTVSECSSNEHYFNGTINSYPDYLFGIILGVNPDQIIQVQDRLGLYIKKNLVLAVIIEDEDNSSRQKLINIIEHMNLTKISIERLVFSVLETFINDDLHLLMKIEEEISLQEDKINSRKPNKDFIIQITDVGKRLLLLDNYYQQFVSICEELEENSEDIFSDDNLHYFRILSGRAMRLSNNTRMLQEYSIHVREAYHSQLDNDLNKIMKLFTVVTTIFLPLTLLVGWYGMNFTTMPELTWQYGYYYVIVLSIIIAILCILYFKKKKFM